jgi:cytochrome c oxidase subunit 3
MTSTEELKRDGQTKKLLLLFAIISMVMMFGGLTSAVIVSASREDWLTKMIMPSSFIISTVLMVIGSVVYHLALTFIKKDDRQRTMVMLLAALFIAFLFAFFQFRGFQEIIAQGYYFTGESSNVRATFIYVIALMHLLHLLGGVLATLIIIYKHFKQKYNATQYVGIELGAIYWHFLDLLWILLFLFFYLY